MAYTPLTKTQYIKLREAGYSQDKILEFEQRRKQDFSKVEPKKEKNFIEKSLDVGSSLFSGTGKLVGGAILQGADVLSLPGKKQARESTLALSELTQKALDKAKELMANGETDKAKRLLRVAAENDSIDPEDLFFEASKQTPGQIAGSAAQTALETSPFSKLGAVSALTGAVGNVASKIPGATKVAETVGNIASKYPKTAGAVKGALEGQKYASGFQASEALQEGGDTIDALQAGITPNPLAIGLGAPLGAFAGSMTPEARAIYKKQKQDKAETAIGRVLQGEIDDIEKAKQVFKDIDTSDIKTYQDAVDTVTAKEKALVDAKNKALAQDRVQYTPERLTITTKSGAKHNFVDDAIDQLEAQYRAINDVDKLEEIYRFRNSYEAGRVTAQDIDQLAVRHGQDLSGFNASGELASGLKKQASENTRKGLKETSRQLFGNPLIKEADTELSNTIRIRELLEAQKDKVFADKQKVVKLGLGGRATRTILDLLDKISLGSVRGGLSLLDGRIQKDVTRLSNIDLEKQLAKNFKLIDEVFSGAPSEATIIKRLNNLSAKLERENASIMGLPEGAIRTPLTDTSGSFKRAPTVLQQEARPGQKAIPQKTKEQTNPIATPFTMMEQGVPVKQVKSGAYSSNLQRRLTPERVVEGKVVDKSIKNVSDDLIKEARKYKSAEEFVKAQGAPLYHGSKKYIVGELKTGTKGSRGAGIYTTPDITQAQRYGDVVETFIDKNANVFEFNKKTPFELKKDIVSFLKKNNIKYEDRDNFIFSDIGNIDLGYEISLKSFNDFINSAGKDKFFKDLGYDVARFGDGERQIVIYNPKSIKTKSQLEQIWKEANKK